VRKVEKPVRHRNIVLSEFVPGKRIAITSLGSGIQANETGFRIKPGITIIGRLTAQFFALLLFVLCALMITSQLVMASSESVERQKGPAEWAEARRLEGRWVRPDGGYVLELRNIQKNGGLKASYFNPRTIKVYKASWRYKKGLISVFVELRDINYPGSKYDLRYDPATDSLRGTYFQAVEKETYNIEFMRIK
jgi:hypothetical protein